MNDQLMRLPSGRLTGYEAGTITLSNHHLHEMARILAVSVEQLRGID